MIWPFKNKNKEKWPPERSDAWPRYINGLEAIACWTNQEKTKRVFLIKKSDGTFSYDSQYFSDDEFEMCWILDGIGKSIYDSKEIAEKEIHGNFPWTKNIKPETKIA